MRVLLVVVAALCVSVGAVSIAAASSPRTVAAKKDSLTKIKPSKTCKHAGEAPCLSLTTDFFKADGKRETYLRVVGANLLPQSDATVTYTYLAPGDTVRQASSFPVSTDLDGNLDSWTNLTLISARRAAINSRTSPQQQRPSTARPLCPTLSIVPAAETGRRQAPGVANGVSALVTANRPSHRTAARSKALGWRSRITTQAKVAAHTNSALDTRSYS